RRRQAGCRSDRNDGSAGFEPAGLLGEAHVRYASRRPQADRRKHGAARPRVGAIRITVMAVLVLCGLSVPGAIVLILEMEQPLQGGSRSRARRSVTRSRISANSCAVKRRLAKGSLLVALVMAIGLPPRSFADEMQATVEPARSAGKLAEEFNDPLTTF